jgi:DNA gyrase subunit A
VEPFVLPSKFPLVLLNGTSGIGYTLSSDIPPYNLNEIADATIKLLKNPKANVHLVPDSPTGCDIIECDDSSFIMQSSFDIDSVNYVITFKNTPYLKYLDKIDKALREIQDSSNPISEILSADDESNLLEGKLRYVIRCKPCNLYSVINTLFKRVPGFRSSISTRNMMVVDQALNIRYYNIRQILCEWIKARLLEKRGWFLRELVAKTTDSNMLEGKAFMLSPENLEKTVKIFRSCKSKSEIIPALVKGYKGKVTTSQANYISELRLHQLTSSEYDKTYEMIADLKQEIEYIRSVVEDPDKIRDVIIDELKSIKAKYGNPRRSTILNNRKQELVNIGVVQILPDGSILFSETENPEHLSSDITPVSGDNVCLIDTNGRFIWVDTNKVPHDKPMTLTSIGRDQMDKCISAVSNQDNDVLFLTNKGRIKYMPINKIPTNATRKPLIPLSDDEHIVTVLELCDTSSDILIYTKDGMGKRIQTSDLNKVMSVDAAGQFIMNDYDVSGMFCINPSKPYLVYVTQLGRMRVNTLKFLPTVKKFANPKPIIKLSSQDDLISVFCANKEQSVTLSHVDGRVTTVNIDSLGTSTMAVPPTRPKHVPSVKILRATLT